MNWEVYAKFATHQLGGLVLAHAYVAAFVLYAAPHAELLAAAGRLSLTNYLAQSLILSFVAYGYGLGLYGQSGPAGCLALAGGIFCLQLLWSPWWLRRFSVGPAEWLLRRCALVRPK
jgi:uncharacterized protein